MFPSEMVILMAIAINKDTGKKLLSRPMDVTGDYISYLYNSLVNRGYLRGNKVTGYKLTSIGAESLSEFLNRNGTMAKDTLKRLKQLGIEVNQAQEQKIYKLKKEGIKVT